jgi:hypothetical protein
MEVIFSTLLNPHSKENFWWQGNFSCSLYQGPLPLIFQARGTIFLADAQKICA